MHVVKLLNALKKFGIQAPWWWAIRGVVVRLGNKEALACMVEATEQAGANPSLRLRQIDEPLLQSIR
ncbi:hypothetical protein CK221_14290 [Mesorhizobium sp. WSM3868]|nr:hypothetical protein CK221_14290 [Mesorhizobium sp. WSM3868]